MKSFERAADTYESAGLIQREMADWLAEWIPNRRAGFAVEAGAGTGFLTRRLQPWEGSFLATDASAAMVARGRARCPTADWQTLRADHLPPVSSQWIFSSSFLQWAEDPEALLLHWRSRLARRGRLLAGLFVAPTLPELAEVLPGCAPLRWRTPAEWEEIVSRAGMDLDRSEVRERVFRFPSALELLRSLHRTGAAQSRRTPAPILRRALRDYDRRFGGGEVGVRSTWTFYRFEAENPGEA